MAGLIVTSSSDQGKEMRNVGGMERTGGTQYMFVASAGGSLRG
jgi:hypothetical protein